jgi:hypothetical protein
MVKELSHEDIFIKADHKKALALTYKNVPRSPNLPV